MAGATKRIQLPSGGWWELQTRPLWKHVRQWGAGGSGRASDPNMADVALASLTTGWSFSEEVSLEALARREVGDLLAVHQVFWREVLPFLEAESPKEAAQQLFASLAAGRVPPGFAEAHLMASTGWTWQTLQDTPADVVQRMWIYLAVAQARVTQGALDFPDMEDS